MPIQFTTDGSPGHRRLALWQDIVCDVFVGLDCKSDLGSAFLDDIANDAVPTTSRGIALPQDGDTALGFANADGSTTGLTAQGRNLAYDNELLDRHFITGDGRGNENIGLTAVHTIFHSEHNRLVEANKATILASLDDDKAEEVVTIDLRGRSAMADHMVICAPVGSTVHTVSITASAGSAASSDARRRSRSRRASRARSVGWGSVIAPSRSGCTRRMPPC